jgi:hypothetical protein
VSPAGSGAIRYIPKPQKRLAWTILATAGLLSILLLMSGGSAAHASTRAPVDALSLGWAEFQADCTAGPAPGQGSTPLACVCWEGQLQAAAILPAYAVDALDAAQVGGGPAFTVGENLGGSALGAAMAGCGLRG